MLTMKQYFALIAALAAAACHAQSLPAGGQSTSDLRQVGAQKPLPAHSATPRQLSDQERAELRRQLSQYSRVTGKGS
jgi:hypothetical protein